SSRSPAMSSCRCMRKSGASHGGGPAPPRPGRHPIFGWVCRPALHPSPGGDLSPVAFLGREFFPHPAKRRERTHAFSPPTPPLRADRASCTRALQEAIDGG